MSQPSFEELDKVKQEGNQYFKQKNIQAALEKFSEGFHLIKTNYNDILQKAEKDSSNPNKDKIVTLYLQFLTNKALCELNTNQNEEVIKSTLEVLKFDVNNPKALYRNAVAHKNIADTILQEAGNIKEISVENIKIMQTYYEEGRFQLEMLSKLEPNNKSVTTELSNIVKQAVKVKLQIRELKKQFPEQFSQDDNKLKGDFLNEPQLKHNEVIKQREEEERRQKEEKQKQLNRRIINELDTKELEKISKIAIQNNTDQLIQQDELPENASIFEKNIAAFKKTPEKLFYYLKKIPGDYLKQIYSKKDLPLESLLNIINALQKYGVEENKQVCLDLMQGIASTNKFHLLTMQMMKSEKNSIKQLLEQIGAKEELFIKFKV